MIKNWFLIENELNWKNRPFDICLNLLIMCKEGWLVGLGQEGVVWRWRELSDIPEKGVELTLRAM